MCSPYVNSIITKYELPKKMLVVLYKATWFIDKCYRKFRFCHIFDMYICLPIYKSIIQSNDPSLHQLLVFLSPS